MELSDLMAWEIYLEWQEKEGLDIYPLTNEEIISLIKFVWEKKEVEMAVMTCPRCGGGGSIIQGNAGTTTGQYSVPCPSCCGSGYVTDNPQPAVRDLGAELVSAHIQCPHCGGMLKVTPEVWKFGKPQRL